MAKAEHELTWKDIEIGAVVTEPGSARANQTGFWRSQRPTYDHRKCIRCGLCALYCPEGCVRPMPEKGGVFEADFYWCKGCGLCARECPTRVITMVEEEE
ncbi:MAG: 4Fe-4S binding protein [Chloroflexota bacterium]